MHNSQPPAPDPERGPLIRLDHVRRTFQVGPRLFDALKDVSLTIQPGEFAAIVGPSGSGKSTLLNLIAGIDKPNQGEVWVLGVRVDRMDENALARWRGHAVGVMFQFFQLLPTLTVLENVALPMQLRQMWARPDLAHARALLERVGMSDHLTKLPSELSGGEKQRVALARALVNAPPLLIADEPTGNLDTATGEQIIGLLADEHAGGTTVVLVTHEARLAAVATRRITMQDGRIADDDGPTLANDHAEVGL